MDVLTLLARAASGTRAASVARAQLAIKTTGEGDVRAAARALAQNEHKLLQYVWRAETPARTCDERQARAESKCGALSLIRTVRASGSRETATAEWHGGRTVFSDWLRAPPAVQLRRVQTRHPPRRAYA